MKTRPLFALTTVLPLFVAGLSGCGLMNSSQRGKSEGVSAVPVAASAPAVASTSFKCLNSANGSPVTDPITHMSTCQFDFTVTDFGEINTEEAVAVPLQSARFHGSLQANFKELKKSLTLNKEATVSEQLIKMELEIFKLPGKKIPFVITLKPKFIGSGGNDCSSTISDVEPRMSKISGDSGMQLPLGFFWPVEPMIELINTNAKLKETLKAFANAGMCQSTLIQ